jgi:3-hydroxyacyl-CoA dehydrogenase/enoyl-CoA hydratase/3-hydroxybutyryl-CoA epimerase/enoyl-CoA isomerase
MYQGEAFELSLKDEIYHLVFNLKNTSANVLNSQALKELGECLELMKKNVAKGMILSSAKEGFIFGADVTEFLTHFKKTDQELKTWISEINKIFNDIEDLPFPKVAAINGFALGGGFELALTSEYRIAGIKAQVGLPETKLGIMPGWGGTVRLPRLIGADFAIEWITSAKYVKADEALKLGAIDGVVEESQLLQAALKTLKHAMDGHLDWKKKQADKKAPLKLDKIESMMSFEGAKGMVFAAAGPHYPAPLKVVEEIQKGARCSRDEALVFETDAFVFCAKTPQAESLVQVFLGDQYLKKVSKKITDGCIPTKKAAILGAGIMGGGISYQSASTGTPVIMKDIKTEQLDLGMNEASKLLTKLVESKKMNQDKMAKVITSITPTLTFGDFTQVDFVVEAVVENEKVKKTVLADVENAVDPKTIVASNTSTISITSLSEGLKRPENFIGMHFFNPVHRMPLVEIIRGKKSSEASVAKGVQYALQMGKTPIVVNDCPGFLVNRILFPYFNGFIFMIDDGVEFTRIDKVMEKFGWPMGPAYLLDVVGIDTGEHASKIMAQGFPDRMSFKEKTILQAMYENKRFGQKNAKGFYEYEIDKKGKPKKVLNPEVYNIIKPIVKRTVEVSDEDILMRMMLPMIFEASRCLEDKIVNSATEVDMGLLLGLGFPPFRAGALKYADGLGHKKIVESAAKFAHLGKLYEPTNTIKEFAQTNKTFY